MSADIFAPYREVHEQTLNKCIQLKEGADWKFSKEEDGVKFYTAPAEGSSFAMVKSETVIKAPKAAVNDRIAKTPKVDANTPDNQRDGAQERWLSHTVDDDTRATFMYIDLISPSRLVSERDFLMFRRCYERDGVHIQLNVSIKNDEIKPEVKGRVRAHMFFQIFFVEKIDEETTKLTFMCHADPMGSIPAFVYNAGAVGQGAALKTIRKDLEK